MDSTAPTNDLSMRMQIMQHYIDATDAAAELNIWLTATVQRGNPLSKIQPFERAFIKLFMMTKHLGRMREESCAQYIETWMKMQAATKYLPSNLKVALQLFEVWREALIEQSILEFR